MTLLPVYTNSPEQRKPMTLPPISFSNGPPTYPSTTFPLNTKNHHHCLSLEERTTQTKTTTTKQKQKQKQKRMQKKEEENTIYAHEDEGAPGALNEDEGAPGKD